MASRHIQGYPRLKAGVAGGVYETMLDSIVGLNVLILVGGHRWEGDDLVEPAHRLGVPREVSGYTEPFGFFRKGVYGIQVYG